MGELLDGKYLLGRLLGKGGMGEVYEAEQVAVRRKVAVKLLRPGLAVDPEAVQRLRREAEMLAALDHPHLVRFYDFGQTDDGRVYLVMELLEGEDLTMVLERAGPAPFERILPILIDVLEALETCHAKGFIHRDMKPSNVFLARAPDGTVTTKILDFGVARTVTYEGTALTVTGGLVGTAAYMAPEQARGEEIDPRADLYAVGAILYHALTGAAPFEASSFQGVLARVLTEEPPPLRTRRPELRIPEAAERLCSWSMARQREERPKSATELRLAMQEAIAGRRSLPLVPRPAKPRKAGSRRGIFWIVAVLLLLGGAAAGAIGMASLGGSGTSARSTTAPATPATTAPTAPATTAPATAAPAPAAPPAKAPQVDITPTLPPPPIVLPTPTGEVQITPLGPGDTSAPRPTKAVSPVSDADVAAALERPACKMAESMRSTWGDAQGARAVALSVAAMSSAGCGDCEAFARAAIRQNADWDLAHYQLATCLMVQGGEAGYCVIVEEMRRFLRLSRRRQPSSILRAPYRQAAPQVISAYRTLCRQRRGRR